MKRWHAAIILGAALAAPVRADEAPFSQVLKPEDYSAAGLEKLTPAERARLDQLIQDYRSGALEAARQQAAVAAAAQAAAEARAARAESEAGAARAQAAQAQAAQAQAAADARAAQAAEAAQAQARKSQGSLISRAKALITPGTQVEYQALEAHIVGEVNGWEAHTVFTLDNGQAWQVADYTRYVNGGAVRNPKVTVKPAGMLGGFRMAIEGMGEMRVRLINGTTYRPN